LKYTDPSGYVKAEVEPELIWTNPGWLKYADPTHLNNYSPFDFLESGGGGAGYYYKDGEYYNNRQEQVKWKEVYYNYIKPNSILSLKGQDAWNFIENYINYCISATSGGDGLLPPVDAKYPITSPYTEGNRVIPELGINRPHLAIDIGTPVGTPIRSPWSGRVVMAQDTKYGLSVIIKHDYLYNGQYIQTGYAHLSEMNVTNGLTINRGDIIGYTGTWGTGPHLHFTLRIGDQKVNPTILFPYK